MAENANNDATCTCIENVTVLLMCVCVFVGQREFFNSKFSLERVEHMIYLLLFFFYCFHIAMKNHKNHP